MGSAPASVAPPATPVTTLPGVEATCTTTTPDSQTIDVRCVGRYPFTLHKDWTITWEGQSEVIGSYDPGGDGKPGRITIDMLTGTPNYAMAKGFGISAEVSGPVHTGMAGKLEVSVGDYGGDTLKLPSAKRLRIIAEMVPGKQNAGADVALTVTAGGKAAPGAVILPTGDPAIVDVVLHGGSPQHRMNQAQDIHVIGTATLGDCSRLSDHTLLELMLAQGQQP